MNCIRLRSKHYVTSRAPRSTNKFLTALMIIFESFRLITWQVADEMRSPIPRRERVSKAVDLSPAAMLPRTYEGVSKTIPQNTRVRSRKLTFQMVNQDFIACCFRLHRNRSSKIDLITLGRLAAGSPTHCNVILDRVRLFAIGVNIGILFDIA